MTLKIIAQLMLYYTDLSKKKTQFKKKLKGKKANTYPSPRTIKYHRISHSYSALKFIATLARSEPASNLFI